MRSSIPRREKAGGRLFVSQKMTRLRSILTPPRSLFGKSTRDYVNLYWQDNTHLGVLPYLRFGVIQLAKGKGALYHRMMESAARPTYQMGPTSVPDDGKASSSARGMSRCSATLSTGSGWNEKSKETDTVRWWLNLISRFRYHPAPQKRRQACSSKRVLMRKFRRRHGSTRLGGLTTYLVQMLGLLQCFGMSVMEGREGAGNTDIRRYMIATLGEGL